jgi:adenine-specific DNA-methyltransferase
MRPSESRTVSPFAFDELRDRLCFVERYSPEAIVTLYPGDRLDLLRTIPPSEARLIVTSPPYNIGKKYERRVDFSDYLAEQQDTIRECYRVLAADGSICWQVGNHITRDGEAYPLDIWLYPIFKELGFKLRNRIIWRFGHGMHLSKRFSPRYETILWFTKSDRYVFNLDAVRLPQKYPGKRYYKGPKAGQYSGNPLGKNPEDVWEIPHVKSAHPEKTIHPCQFPVELIERLVLAMTNIDDLVVDPYTGVGSAPCAAVLHRRRAAAADIVPEYIEIARDRIAAALEGRLPHRVMGTPIYEPKPNDKLACRPPAFGALSADAETMRVQHPEG